MQNMRARIERGNIKLERRDAIQVGQSPSPRKTSIDKRRLCVTSQRTAPPNQA